MANPTCLGVIFGNRDFFPDVLISEARRDLIKLFAELEIEPVWLTPEESKLGAVETWADAQKCGELLRRNRERIEGILVCLPNFGDEKGVADSIRLAETQCASSGAGLPGRSRSVWPGPAARRFLRQDFRLQQPAAVSHQVLAHARSYSGDSSMRGSEKTWCTLSRPAKWCAA